MLWFLINSDWLLSFFFFFKINRFLIWQSWRILNHFSNYISDSNLIFVIDKVEAKSELSLQDLYAAMNLIFLTRDTRKTCWLAPGFDILRWNIL